VQQLYRGSGGGGQPAVVITVGGGHRHAELGANPGTARENRVVQSTGELWRAVFTGGKRNRLLQPGLTIKQLSIHGQTPTGVRFGLHIMM
jgi:hypothetical protein